MFAFTTISTALQRVIPRSTYAKCALATQRLGLSKLSRYCAYRAGFFEK